LIPSDQLEKGMVHNTSYLGNGPINDWRVPDTPFVLKAQLHQYTVTDVTAFSRSR
jgi:hypothetical protein